MKLATRSVLPFLVVSFVAAVAACGGGGGGSGGGGGGGGSSSGGGSGSSSSSGGSGGQAAFGADCSASNDCATGLCLTGSWGGFCTHSCTQPSDCPQTGWECNLSPYTACVPNH
jgi:hypothetical protein